MFRRLLSKLKPSSTRSASNGSKKDVKTRHLSCPRCRRLLIVPTANTFRCQCSMVFRVTGTTNDQLQLCLSLRDSDTNGRGCGLPRKLVERMPVTIVSSEMCLATKTAERAPSSGPTEEAKTDAMDGTCRICLSEYKAGDSVRVLPCFHRFHVNEIDDWLDRNTTCPLCHLDISEALTGSSGLAVLSAFDGNPTPVIVRRRRRR